MFVLQNEYIISLLTFSWQIQPQINMYKKGLTTIKKFEENNYNKDIFLPGRRGQGGSIC